MTIIQTKAPGKLYIAGEYAVVEPGYSAIITTVDRFIHLSLAESEPKTGYIYSEGFTPEPAEWYRSRKRLWFRKQNPRLKYVRSAIHTTERYIAELGIPLRFYNIDITSELDRDERKLGLGSSGAITAATIRALLQFYGVSDKDMLVYKLGVIAQMRLGVNSSFGDLAATCFTGWIKYTSFDRDFVSSRLRRFSVKKLVEAPWPALDIQPLVVPEQVQFLIGWTGSPASSNHLVGKVQDKKQQSQADYQHFLNESKASVEQLAHALEANLSSEIKAALVRNRAALLAMGLQTNVLIETPQLKLLIDIAEQYGAVAKTSGAGGGDSGIAFVFEDTLLDELLNAWAKVEIIHLPLNIYYHS